MAGPFGSAQFGDREAFFERIVHHHARLLYRVAYSVLRNPADAEDAVADAVLKLIRSGAWQAVTNERAFLARSVWRAALDRLGARVPGGAEDPDVVLRRVEDLRPSPEHSAATAEERAVLHALIERLPAELRDPLLLSAVEELNSGEIGEMLHLPEGTVRTRLMRARQRLRAEFEALDNGSRDRVAAMQTMGREGLRSTP